MQRNPRAVNDIDLVKWYASTVKTVMHIGSGDLNCTASLIAAHPCRVLLDRMASNDAACLHPLLSTSRSSERGPASQTSAFVFAALRRLITYDIKRQETVNYLVEAAIEMGVDFEFREQDVLQADIEPTDLHFIDTWHVDRQIRAELARHAHKVRRYVVLDDMET